VSPVLVVLDYADGRVEDAIALLKALRVRRGPPAVVLAADVYHDVTLRCMLSWHTRRLMSRCARSYLR